MRATRHTRHPHARGRARHALAVRCAAAIQYRPDKARATADPLPPSRVKTTGLLQLSDGLWALKQDFVLNENIYSNSHLVRLRSGGLLMHSPPARTEEAEALLDSVPGGAGRVDHVVLPNLSPEHWIHAPDWAARCGGATVWTVPGLLQGRSTASLLGGPARVAQLREGFARVAELPAGGGWLPGLEGEVGVATYTSVAQLFTESNLFFADHRAVTVADMAFAAYDHPLSPLVGEAGAKVAGIYKRLGCPLAYNIMAFDRAGGRRWLDQVLAWDPDLVLACHLDPVVPNAREELRRCFGFLLE